MQGFTYKYGDRPLEGYTIQRAAGRGGFGEVYYALSDSGREVALKVVQGFEDIELRGISQCMNLKSPHLVTIFDVKHNDQGKPFVIMEFVNGPSLRELIDESPAGLGTQKAAFFLREMAKGLTYLHDRGLVHRDLKPGNVFYEDGYVKIGDYGLSKAISASKHSGQTITVGTVHYMAPEIGQGRYDRSIDIYALGCMLYEMLTGQTPFLGGSTGEILMKHLVEEPKLQGIDEPFAGVIRKALAKDPKDRFQTVQEMVEAIFGAAHIQQSVSCFSPDNLTMVAGRVARTVTAGGPGSSGQIDLTGQRPAQPDVAGKLGQFGQRINEIGERIGEAAGIVGQRIEQEFQRAGRQMDERERRQGGQPTADSGPAPLPPPLPSDVMLFDIQRDPMGRKAHLLLTMITAVVMAGGTAVLSVQSFGGQFPQTWLACCMVIWGAANGLVAAGRRLEPALRKETPFVRHLAYGGLACVLGAIFSLVSILATRGQAHLIMQERDIRGTALSIAIVLFLMDWSKIVDPARRERIALGPALNAALLGFLANLFFAGNAPFVIGTLAGIALAVQARSPFDPLAIRGRKKSREVKIRGELEPGGDAPDRPTRREQRVQLRQDRHEQRQERADQRRQDRIERFNRVVTALDLHAQPHPLSAQARVALVIIGVVLLGLGLAGILAFIMDSVDLSDRVAFIFLGADGVLVSLWMLGVARRGRMINPWATFVRPLLMMACIAAVMAASAALSGVGGRLDSDEVTAAMFFIIFPPILMIILGVLPRSLAPTAAGQGQPGSANATIPLDDHSWSGDHPMFASGVSPYKRIVGLILAACGFVGICGLHRFYVGKIGTGLLWMFTGGGFAIGQIVDAINIATGRFTDKQGRRLVMWTDRDELDYAWQGRAPGWQAPPPPPRDVPNTNAAAGAAATNDSNAGGHAASAVATAPVAAPWHGEPWNSGAGRQPSHTSRILAAFSGLLMVLSMLASLAGIASIPVAAFIAENHPGVTGTEGFRILAGTLPMLAMGLGAGLMVLAAIPLIVARRWGGGAHMLRGIIGQAGLLGAVYKLSAALDPWAIDWPKQMSLVHHGYAVDVVFDVANRAYAHGLVLAVLMTLGSVLVLAWLPRRQEQMPAVGKGV